MPRRNRTIKHSFRTTPSSCNAKRKFSNERVAILEAETRELATNLEFSTYKCDRCSGWHLTKKKAI